MFILMFSDSQWFCSKFLARILLAWFMSFHQAWDLRLRQWVSNSYGSLTQKFKTIAGASQCAMSTWLIRILDDTRLRSSCGQFLSYRCLLHQINVHISPCHALFRQRITYPVILVREVVDQIVKPVSSSDLWTLTITGIWKAGENDASRCEQPNSRHSTCLSHP